MVRTTTTPTYGQQLFWSSGEVHQLCIRSFLFLFRSFPFFVCSFSFWPVCCLCPLFILVDSIHIKRWTRFNTTPKHRHTPPTKEERIRKRQVHKNIYSFRQFVCSPYLLILWLCVCVCVFYFIFFCSGVGIVVVFSSFSTQQYNIVCVPLYSVAVFVYCV